MKWNAISTEVISHGVLLTPLGPGFPGPKRETQSRPQVLP